MNKNHKNLDHLSKILSAPDGIINEKLPQSLKCVVISQNWKKIIGSRWGDVSRPTGLSHRCLTVNLPSACHIQEAHFEKEAFITKINQFAGCRLITDIRWIC